MWGLEKLDSVTELMALLKAKRQVEAALPAAGWPPATGGSPPYTEGGGYGTDGRREDRPGSHGGGAGPPAAGRGLRLDPPAARDDPRQHVGGDEEVQAIGAARIPDPRQPVFALDHDIQNTSEENLEKYRKIEAFAREQGVDFYPAGTGIGHQIMWSRATSCRARSSWPPTPTPTCTGRWARWARRSCAPTPPRSGPPASSGGRSRARCRSSSKGKLRRGVTGKDVIIALCGLYNKEEVLNAAVEFTGPGVAALSMDARLASPT